MAQTLAYFASDAGADIYPGVARLMKALGVQKSTVHGHIQQLIQKGVLERDGFCRHTRRLRFNLDRLVDYEPGSAVTQQGSTPVEPSEGPHRVRAGGQNRPRRRSKGSTPVDKRVHARGPDHQDRQDRQDHQTGADAPASSAEDGTEPSCAAPFRLYVAIAEQAIAQSQRPDGSSDYPGCKEWFRQLCAQRGLRYDSNLAGKAVHAAWPAGERPRQRGTKPRRFPSRTIA